MFTLAAAPAVFLGLLELALRLAGFGYPTSFLLSNIHDGRKVFVQNNQFGWRFFGPELARWPYPFMIQQSKPTNTVRILVLGESAARGEPQPDFGLPRVLHAMLSLRYPDTRFEVVNTAMTAINSHTILPIARDCARARADIWVIYMGNNEVVGPFGAGTVFGKQTPPLPVIRSSLALRATRSGQWLDRLLNGMERSQQTESVWGGMTMFLDQQVRADDPRLHRVYHHFQQNLADILRVGKRAGAGIVVSTVAVNMSDCPPFASAHKPGLSAEEKAKWEELFQRGIAAQHQTNLPLAAGLFSAAAQIDDTFAELRFRQGQCALALGDSSNTRRHFQAARDQDTLRFRCDSRLNEVIRRLATDRANDRILLAEAEFSLAEQGSAGLPGAELFYEHVHPTFVGNHRLARTIAEQVERLLPGWVNTTNESGKPWPSASDCAQRLGWSDWQEAAALNSILTTLNDPPFPGQLDHEVRMRRLEAVLGGLASAMHPAGIADALKRCEEAVAAVPDDPVLHKLLARLRQTAGDLTGATVAVRRELELLPSDSDGWALLGSVLAQQGRLDDAAVVFRRAFQFGPQGIKSRLDLAAALGALGRDDEAREEYERTLQMKPRCVPALLQLGLLLEKLGRKAEGERLFRQALTNRNLRLPELMELGAFFQNRGSFLAAAEVYTDAIKLNPNSAPLQLAAGRNLASLGRYEEAARHAAQAVRLAPDFVEARLLYGIALWRRGLSSKALSEFQEALRLQPESLDARVNLGIVLSHQGRRAEALAMFREVLERSPTNALALQFVESHGRDDRMKSPERSK